MGFTHKYRGKKKKRRGEKELEEVGGVWGGGQWNVNGRKLDKLWVENHEQLEMGIKNKD